MSDKVTIIMYHYVRDLANSKYPAIKGLDAALFSEQVAYLDKHYRVISMEQLIDSIEHGTSLPAKSALLSFDDGYTDHYDYVMPVLRKYRMQGSFFPPAKAILEGRLLDVNKIHFILAATSDEDLLIQELFAQLDKYRQEYQLISNEAYYEKHAVARRRDNARVMFIKQMLQVVLPEKLRLVICDHLFNKYVSNDEAAFCRELYMSPDQIRELRAEGMHIGSHSYDHYWLGSLTKQKQEEEISRSMDFLKTVGVDLNNWTMCYPYGNYNQDTIDILTNNQCKLALTTHTAIASLKSYTRFELPRLDTNEIPKEASAPVNHWFEEA
ncbi:MAG: polysaccharide deacetylase family protein [Bacteroidetes bacterium]|nr:polysaccharide deacetylase family protein [Bacteroidota bacterium]